MIYIWFIWKGDPNLDPGGKFNIIDGLIRNRKLMTASLNAKGMGFNYQRYLVYVRFTKFYDVRRLPVDSQMLNIYVEDSTRDGSKLRFIPDSASNYSTRMAIPGYQMVGFTQVSKPHAYRSNYSDPQEESQVGAVFSQYIIGLIIKRNGYGFYFKIFLALFASELFVLCSFFFKPNEGMRVAVSAGAFFGAVSNNYVVNSLLPPSGSFGLVDYVSGVGLFMIFSCLVLTLLSNYYFSNKEEKELSEVIDKLMFYIMATGCLVANIVIPLCARD